MRRITTAPLVGAVLAAATFGLAACGGSSDSGSTSSGSSSSSSSNSSKYGTGAVVPGQNGGTLHVMSSGDVDYIDPGAGFYQFTFIVTYATQRPLFSYKPDEAQKSVPDLAAGPADVSSDGKTITIKIRPGVKFSPPVNREATSADVKYAIERGFNPHVANGYVGAYFGDIVGAKTAKGGPIAGIQAPDDHTIVFKLTRANAAMVIGALSLPLSAPVPKEYAAKYDAMKTPNQYGFHQVATGPYMVQNDASGKTIGYSPNRKIVLVRNPNWDKSTDYRPAYLDRVEINEGNSDPVGTSRRILSGSGMVNAQADFNPPPQILKSLSNGEQSDQLTVGPPTGRVRFVALNTTVKPFDDLNVRKAVAAAMNRTAMRQQMGGPLSGDIPTHFLPATIPGYDDAGGAEGPGFDYLAKPEGDMALAQSYMKKAGFSGGKYTGGETFQMVADNTSPTKDAAQVAQNALTGLGFKVKLVQVTHDSMYTKFCNVPAQKVAICPSVGWQKDFPDPASILEPTFKGSNILPTNNSNWPQFNDPAVDAAMTKADPITDAAQRAAAFGEIDKQITAQVPGIPWLWDKTLGIRSKDVNGVINAFNASWDVTYTSLKR
jgi:peptide/nickel transport system substrate-binding protein